MTPVGPQGGGNGYHEPWLRVVSLAEESARQAEAQTRLLEAIQKALDAQRERNEVLVADAREAIGRTLKSEIRTSDHWWRVAFIIATTAIALSSLFGRAASYGVDRWIGIIKP